MVTTLPYIHVIIWTTTLPYMHVIIWTPSFSESALQTEKQRVADAEGEMARLQKELSTSQTIISQQEDTQQRM